MTRKLSTLFASKNFTLVFIIGYAAIYLLTRVINLTLLPAHFDELVQLSRLHELLFDGNIFVGLSNDFKWLQLWLIAAIYWLPASELWIGRLASILAGLAGGIGCYLLALELYRKPIVAVLSAVLYMFTPFVLLYDRLILSDGLLTSLGVWVMLFSAWAVRRQQVRWAVFAGIAITAASLTKVSGIGYLGVPVAAWFLLKPKQGLLKTWQFLVAIYVPAVVGVIITLFFIDSQNMSIYTSKLFDEGSVAEQFVWLSNSKTALEWITNLMTLPLALIGGAGAVLSLIRRNRAGLYLLVVPVIMAVPYIFVAKVWYPRYLLPVVPSLLLLAAVALDSGQQWWAKFKWGQYIFGLILLLILLPALQINFWLLVDPPQASLHPDERRQYIEGWPTTYGLAPAADYVEKLAQNYPEMYLAINEKSFLVREGLNQYFDQPDNVKIVEFDPFSGHALQDLDRWALEKPTILILNPAREKGLDDFWTNSQLFVQAKKLAGFNKPANKTSMDVYQWHSIPGLAENWAIWSGVNQPVIMSAFTEVPDSTGAAQFVPFSNDWANVDFVLIDAETLASGTFLQNSDDWMAQLPDTWALTQYAPGSWHLFRVIDNAPPQNPVQSTLANTIVLNGFDLPPQSFTVGQPVNLILHWQALNTISEDYVIFAQLIGPDGQLYAQQDQPPLRPTGQWQSNQRLAHSYTIPLDENIPPGTYRLIVGMYQPASGQRLPAYRDNGERWQDDAIVLTDVSIQ